MSRLRAPDPNLAVLWQRYIDTRIVEIWSKIYRPFPYTSINQNIALPALEFQRETLDAEVWRNARSTTVYKVETLYMHCRITEISDDRRSQNDARRLEMGNRLWLVEARRTRSWITLGSDALLEKSHWTSWELRCLPRLICNNMLSSRGGHEVVFIWPWSVLGESCENVLVGPFRTISSRDPWTNLC